MRVELTYHVKTTHPWHLDVEKQEIGFEFAYPRRRFIIDNQCVQNVGGLTNHGESEGKHSCPYPQ